MGMFVYQSSTDDISKHQENCLALSIRAAATSWIKLDSVLNECAKPIPMETEHIQIDRVIEHITEVRQLPILKD